MQGWRKLLRLRKSSRKSVPVSLCGAVQTLFCHPVGSKAQKIPAAQGNEDADGLGGWEHPEDEAQPWPGCSHTALVGRWCHTRYLCRTWAGLAFEGQEAAANPTMAHQKWGFLGAPLLSHPAPLGNIPGDVGVSWLQGRKCGMSQ